MQAGGRGESNDGYVQQNCSPLYCTSSTTYFCREIKCQRLFPKKEIKGLRAALKIKP
jgi:hypothetical protein